MKKLLIYLFMLFITFNVNTAYSQTPTSKFEKEREARGYLQIAPVTQATTAKQLVSDKSRIGLREQEKLTFLSARQDKLGYTHTRYQQYYKGIEVEGATYIVHEKKGKVESANGGLIQNLNINITPTISEAEALQVAASHVDMMDAVVKLIIFDKKNTRNPNNYRLTYRIDSESHHTSIYIDAHTGEFITEINCLQHGDVPGTGVGAYYGDSLDITIHDIGDEYVLRDDGRNIRIFYANNDGGDIFSEDSIITDIDTHFDNAPHAVDAFWSLQKTYDYFLDSLGLDGYENGDTICALVNRNLSNAYWNGDKIVLGNGSNNPNRTHYTSLDMVAHEYMHAIIQRSSANFTPGDYSESGALSESYPDMFAAVIESIYLPNEDNWVIGERIVTENGKNGLRNLANPYDLTMTQPMAARYYEFDNNEYFNSGISSHAFYLMANSMGIHTAAQIAFRALSYMSSNAQFIDARIAMITAAEQLYGINSNAAQQTAAAWYAVHVGNNYGDNVSSCRERDSLSLIAIHNATGGENWTNIWDLNQSIDTWDGVTLNNSGCVVGLHLSMNNLIDSIPSDIGNLIHLESLSLASNELNYLPDTLWSLVNLLNLSISYNNFKGSLSPKIKNLTKLQTLHIDDNKFSEVPLEIEYLNDLITFDMANNEIVILPNVENLSNLNELWIDRNKFTFKDLDILLRNIPFVAYANQDTIIPTILLGNQLSVDAGGTVGYNTYEWYRDSTLVTTIIGDSTYTPNVTGTYYCKVSNAIITNPNDYYQNFTLRSADFYFDPFSVPVYSGDLNADGVVDERDVILWGWAYGAQGPARDNLSIVWKPHIVDDWQYNVLGVNNKHQDGDGSGHIDQDDLQAIIANFDSMRPIQSSNRMMPISSDYRLEFERDSVVTIPQDNGLSIRRTTYNVFVGSLTEEPTIAHAVVFSIHGNDDYVIRMSANTSYSSLGDSLGIVEVFDSINTVLHLGLSRYDQNPTVLGGPTVGGSVTQIVLDEIWQGGDDTPYMLFTSDVGVLNSSEDENYPINGQEVISSPNLPNGGEGTALADMMVTQPTCNYSGKITIYPNDTSYTYAWGHDATNSTYNAVGLAPGIYTVTVTDGNKQSTIFETALKFPDDCSNEVSFSVDVILEGAYAPDSLIIMNESLRNSTLMQKRDPYLGRQVAFNSVFSLGGSDAIVDWILLELRDKDSLENILYESPALLQRDGKVVNPDGTFPVRLLTTPEVDSFYVVVRHRNHLPIVSPDVISIGHNIIDFTANNSYVPDGAVAVGQKKIKGKWVMHSGDISSDGDINGDDKSIWQTWNGNFNQYLKADLNLDGDVNGADKAIWVYNNGKFGLEVLKK